MRPEIRALQDELEREAYLTDRAVATALYLASSLQKPLLVEGPPGVGKTEIGKVLARVRGADLIRLQCYEGLDASTALYEWNYPKQILRMKLDEGSTRSVDDREASIFSEAFLLKRPLLEAITHQGTPPVLLIDEIDRADEEFEAFLLEVLSDFQVSIPELGTIRASAKPAVILTSNRARELSDALRRRCLYVWIDYPSFERELAIVRRKVPAASATLAHQISAFVQSLRKRQLTRLPGIAETLDWATALATLGVLELEPEVIVETAGCLLKEQRDVAALGATLTRDELNSMMSIVT
ncbi:MAG TPA: MoxR family ATPase [Gemmatimonadaceae bacterium]